MLRHVVSAVAVAATLASVPAFAADKALQAAIASPSRTPANVQRDVYRHPYETLTYFGIKPWMDVVEISPSGGWYTEILAPYLAAEGVYTAAHNNPAASAKAAESVAKFKTRFSDPGYGKINVTAFGKGAYEIAAPGSQDMVLSFRNVHNWYMGDFAPDAFKAFYKALKPGGTLGIVEHRLPESADDAKMKDSGYMKPSYIRENGRSRRLPLCRHVGSQRQPQGHQGLSQGRLDPAAQLCRRRQGQGKVHRHRRIGPRDDEVRQAQEDHVLIDATGVRPAA